MKGKPNNPFDIPDFASTLSKVTDYVRTHQGNKGFINTDNDDHDTIWAFIYDESEFRGVEVQVKAVRVNAHGALEAMVDYDSHVKYSDDDIVESEKQNHDDNIYGTFLDVRWDDNLYFEHTICNIARHIRKYVEKT